jgi:hypothetical protein
VPPETTTPPKYTSSQKFDVRGSRYRKSAEKTTQRRGVHTEGVQPLRCVSVSGLSSLLEERGGEEDL